VAFWDSWFKKKPGGAPIKGAAKPKAKPAAPPKPKEDPLVTAARAKGRTDLERRFKLLNRIGQGSMSKVWRANDTKSGNLVVVKVLDKPKTEALKKRFIGLKRPDEGVVAAQLDHPNIVKTYEFGLTTKGEEYLVMEFVDGVGFNFLVETRGAQIVGKEIDYLVPIGEAIAYFHKKGFIHRDICPRNVMVTQAGVPKLIDFGLAVPDTPDFRKPGNRTGTANYMAPELIRRANTDQRIDVYSFGVTAYETFTGKLPRDNTPSTLDGMMRYINTPARDPREIVPDMPENVVKVLMKGIAPNPEDRYRNMEAFVAALRGLRAAEDE
jgi:serine/threonine protein kinase